MQFNKYCKETKTLCELLVSLSCMQDKKYQIKKSFTICRLLKVDICITQRSPRDHVSAHSDTQNWSSCGEFLEQHSFCNVWVEISNIEGGHWVAGTSWIHRSCRHVSSFSSNNMAFTNYVQLLATCRGNCK